MPMSQKTLKKDGEPLPPDSHSGTELFLSHCFYAASAGLSRIGRSPVVARSNPPTGIASARENHLMLPRGVDTMYLYWSNLRLRFTLTLRVVSNTICRLLEPASASTLCQDSVL